ncbi:MAG TPA: tetratricopeptide repeat protein, partial [Cytophagales bacterium]|nr:tetratricopeptide repeat protein [Cytophagales bacterium]
KASQKTQNKMIDEEKDIEIIERYLDEKLSPQELAEFQERLASDEEFEKSFQTYRVLIEGLKNSGRNTLRQKLKKLEASISVEESFDKKRMGISLNSIYSYSAAATILLLITFTFIFIIRYNSSPTELFAENFEPYPNVIAPTTRGEESGKSPQEQAFYLYDSEQYEQAAVLFEKILKTEEKDPAVLLYTANAYLATGDQASAIKKLESLIKTESHFLTQGLWFISLAYLANNQPEQAKIYLKKLKDQDVSYSQKAEKILENLE